MKYFISGAISKYASTPEGRKEVSDKFMGAEFELITSQIATEVFNPIRLVDEYGWEQDWRFYMEICLKELLYCDAIYMLDGWHNSKGANIEMQLARSLGIKIMVEEFKGSFVIIRDTPTDNPKSRIERIQKLQEDIQKTELETKKYQQ